MHATNYYQRAAARQAAGAVAITVITVALASAVMVLALNGEPLIAGVATITATVVAYFARRAIRIAADNLRFRPRLAENDDAYPERHTAFLHIVDTVRGWDLHDREQYEAVADKHWTGAQEEARARAHAIAVSTGRIDPHDDSVNSPAYLLDILCGVVGGTSGVAVAVLVADLLHPTDYRTLTEWWTIAGLPLPHPMAPAA